MVVFSCYSWENLVGEDNWTDLQERTLSHDETLPPSKIDHRSITIFIPTQLTLRLIKEWDLVKFDYLEEELFEEFADALPSPLPGYWLEVPSLEVVGRCASYDQQIHLLQQKGLFPPTLLEVLIITLVHLKLNHRRLFDDNEIPLTQTRCVEKNQNPHYAVNAGHFSSKGICLYWHDISAFEDFHYLGMLGVRRHALCPREKKIK